MYEKMHNAVNYVDTHNSGTSGNTLNDIINDAANIYADSFDEYMTLSDALTMMFR